MGKADGQEQRPSPVAFLPAGRSQVVAFHPTQLPAPSWTWRQPYRRGIGADEPITISASHRNLHMVSQTVAMLFTVPFFFYASKRLQTPEQRSVALLIAAGVLLIDGFLLYRYATDTAHEPIFAS